MTKSTDIFFDQLKQNLNTLLKNPDFDNEANRHDKLIFPILNNDLGLGWNSKDIWSQKTILVPDELKYEYTFSGGIPKSKRPDIVIKPFENNEIATIIEEKAKQRNIENLKKYNNQLIDYLGLFKCTWGILSDGEKWIIKRGFEDYMVFNNLNELQKNIKDFKEILSKSKMLDRYNQTKSFDLIYFRPQLSFISKYAYKLIEIYLSSKFEKAKLSEEIALLFLAFLNTDYTFEYKLPNDPSNAWSHSFNWNGQLNHIIEIVLIMSKHDRCKRIDLTRYTAESNRQTSIKGSKYFNFQFDSNRIFAESIFSGYLHNTEKFGPGPTFGYINECYGEKVKFDVQTGI